MGVLKKLVGWLFTFPPYRNITASQSEAVVGLLALALHADGAPHPDEREELEREITGVPHFWAAEEQLRRIVREQSARCSDAGPSTDTFRELVEALEPQLGDVPRAFLLTGAAFVCHGDQELTELEKKNLTAMGEVLGVDAADITRIVTEPAAASDAMFDAAD